MPATVNGSFACLDCATPLTASRWIRHVTICNNCGAMMALETTAFVDGPSGESSVMTTLVRGTGAHADQLTPTELKEAQAHRGQFRRRPRR